MTAAEDADDPTVVDRAAAQARNGWGPIPLPTGKKAQPPKGFTGGDHPMPEFADWYATFDDNPAAWGNLGARIPERVVGVDVDAYDGKNGAATWKTLGGPDWPDTIVLSSRFAAGYDGASGIRFYRLPDGIDQGDLWGAHDGIEILRYGHRYAVSPGSDHPNGGVYRLFDMRSKTFLDVLPPWGGLPALSPEQAARLTTAGAPWRGEQAEPRGRDESPICAYSMRILTDAIHDLKTTDSRYGTMSNAVWALVRGEDEGHHLGSALDTLRLAYYAATAADRKAANAENPTSEFDRNVRDAYVKVAADPTDDMFKGCCLPDDRPEPVSVLDGSTSPTLDDEPEEGETAAQRIRRDAAIEELRRMVARDDAQAMFNEAKVGQAKPLDHRPLGTFLATEFPPEQYRIADLWPADGRVLLPAAAKTGKTTLVACNLLPSLADGTPFLGRYDVQPVEGKVVYLNLEVGERTMQRWLADAGVANVDRIIVANLRGSVSALTLASEKGRQRVADWLRSLDAEIVILDPLAPLLASLGLDENSNADVARFFAWWSETLQLAGVADDLICHHTGHAGERSRGASRLLDEPDAIWTLTKDTAGEDESDLGDLFAVAPTRFLQAVGRDVEMAAEALEFDPDTRLLSLTGESKGRAKKRVREASTIEQIRELMKDGTARSKTAIAESLTGIRTNDKGRAVQTFIDTGHLFDSGLRVNRINVLYLWTDTP